MMHGIEGQCELDELGEAKDAEVDGLIRLRPSQQVIRPRLGVGVGVEGA